MSFSYKPLIYIICCTLVNTEKFDLTPVLESKFINYATIVNNVTFYL